MTTLSSSATLKHSVVHRIQIEDDELKVQFTIPTISKNIVILHAEPFTYYAVEDNQYCLFKYSGPEFMMHNQTSECLRPLFADEIVNDIAVGEGCQHRQTFDDTKRFEAHDCHKLSKHNITRPRVQLKHDGMHLRINCQGHNVKIGNLTQGCPNHVFAVKDETSFEIDGFNYKFERSRLVMPAITYEHSVKINLQLGIAQVRFASLTTEDLHELEVASKKTKATQLKMKLVTDEDDSSIFSTNIIGSFIHEIVKQLGGYVAIAVAFFILYIAIKSCQTRRGNHGVAAMVILTLLPLGVLPTYSIHGSRSR